MSEKVNFGFQKVEKESKEPLVQSVFSSVADKYDLMNDILSMGLHRKWKDDLIKVHLRPTKDDVLLDVAGGTGDISRKFLDYGGAHATVLDLNQDMLDAGKRKYADANDMDWVCANAEHLPFEDDSFDFYTISFGLRNVTNTQKALDEAFRVLKPMGKFVCMEFSPSVERPFSYLYDAYSFKILPKIGKMIAGNEEAYRYLAESIKSFYAPTQLLGMIEKAGFTSAEFTTLNFGVVAIHTGYKSL
ncbi:MAG: bifunctional demethylmenaquinone methyltransferase/2-methoxy-6-polyprenyl-1,4-benzoquinol methylase UbiE [Alphaproteobacteria bacterium]|jgi:demethylmenaquinone methyltransferase/2-methoxy-6-polyprenyl-1,4-benzoquinol methylase|nr:bifunctional demethylmenaquinone methyltransferase/2-methoxy-6-polyprenyl-1,4-benzoquinol methylase UbiE [Candidatus Jidaibacter sp.]